MTSKVEQTPGEMPAIKLIFENCFAQVLQDHDGEITQIGDHFVCKFQEKLVILKLMNCPLFSISNKNGGHLHFFYPNADRTHEWLRKHPQAENSLIILISPDQDDLGWMILHEDNFKFYCKSWRFNPCHQFKWVDLNQVVEDNVFNNPTYPVYNEYTGEGVKEDNSETIHYQQLDAIISKQDFQVLTG